MQARASGAVSVPTIPLVDPTLKGSERGQSPERASVLVAALALSVVMPVHSAGVSADALRVRQINKTTDYVLIDVRSAGDFGAGHIQGAESVPLAQVETWTPPEGKEVIVYCPAACPSGTEAVSILAKRGVSRAAVLEGGIDAWKAKGFPVAKAAPPPPMPALPKARGMSAKEARALIGKGGLFVLDVRPREEFLAGHIPGAVNIPLEVYAESKIPAEGKVLVYDRLSGRSREAAGKLIVDGRSAYELLGGLAGWMKMKYPLEVK